MPKTDTNYAQVLNDFRLGKTAMAINASHLLPDFIKVAKFPLGVAPLPRQKQPAAVTDGLSFFLFKQTTPAQQEAACKLIQFLTTPEKIADWSIASASLPVRKSVYETRAVQDYLAKTPQALVVRDQIQVADRDLLVHSPDRIFREVLLNDLQPALMGEASPQESLAKAQQQAEAILAQLK